MTLKNLWQQVVVMSTSAQRGDVDKVDNDNDNDTLV